jgi:hypothetical protein
MAIVDISPIDEEEAAVLRLTREVSGLLAGLPWVLIGGLMVRIIEAEHDARTGWATGEVDVVLDVRALSGAIREAAARLQAAHFVPERHDENLTHRFVRGSDIVDVLAPDHVGTRANRVTVAPDETVEALGSRQALKRKRTIVMSGTSPAYWGWCATRSRCASS